MALEGGSSSDRGVSDPTGKEKLGVVAMMVLVLVFVLVSVLVLVLVLNLKSNC